jgi:MFS family permease
VTARMVVLRRTFSSLKVRNYRLYAAGQLVSMSGTWTQTIAQAWLVLKLTGSGTALGLVTALQFLPILLFGSMGGLLADRVGKRRLLCLTNLAAGLLALTLGLLVVHDVVRLWMVYCIAAGLGLVNAVDNPTRHTFVLEMVGPARLTNAVSLNSVLMNLARVLGPAGAGVLIAAVGLGPCFLLNAGSYLAVIAALLLMRKDELQPAPIQPRRKGQLREGFRYVRSTPALLVPLLMMAVVGTLAYEFQVSLPLVAKFAFKGDAGTYAIMTAVMGGGAVAGGLLTASVRSRKAAMLAGVAIAFGLAQVATALAPLFWIELVALVLLGATSIAFLALGNTTLQLNSSPIMRGRVMGLWAVAFLGSTPVGGPIVGFVGEHLGSRYGLGLGGIASLVVGLAAYRRLSRTARPPARDHSDSDSQAELAGDGALDADEPADSGARRPPSSHPG